MKNLVICAALAVVACAPAWAVNKCTGPDGRVSFQDAPCAGRGEVLDVRPASGRASSLPAAAPSPAADAAPAGGPATDAQRIEGQIAASQRDRRRRVLEREIPADMDAMHRHAVNCELKLMDLKDRKRYTNNNLAGATLESAISNEMTAVATRCDTTAREMRADIESKRNECRALGGCVR